MLKTKHFSTNLPYSIPVALVLFFCIQACNTVNSEILYKEVLEVQVVEVENAGDIIPLEDSLVAPILYSQISGIDSLPIQEKKDKFISAILPAILVAKFKVKKEREYVNKLLTKTAWNDADSTFYKDLCKAYDTDNNRVLLNRMQVHPNSIILAQAIIESGWGSSRVFQDANNMFGVWSYRATEPRIPARFKRDGETIYLRKYNDFAESIDDYLKTVARVNAYREFRAARLETKNPFKLIRFLSSYSERGEEYVIELSAMIRFNKLDRYDSYVIDPAYIQNTDQNE